VSNALVQAVVVVLVPVASIVFNELLELLGGRASLLLVAVAAAAAGVGGNPSTSDN